MLWWPATAAQGPARWIMAVATGAALGVQVEAQPAAAFGPWKARSRNTGFAPKVWR
jgi:hypothetical protein